MSILSIILASVLTVWVISQFGKSIPTRDAYIWWIFGGFIYSAVIFPEMYTPLARLLGFQLASNFILSVSILIFVFYVLKMTIYLDKTKGAQRLIVAEMAAQEFTAKATPQFQEGKKRGLVVVPCYNEIDAIEGVIEELESVSHDQCSLQICVVNDCSRDGTRELLESKHHQKFTSHIVNIGVSGVLLTGFKVADRLDCDFVVQFDGDGQHPADKIPDLLDTAIESGSSLVIGSRFVGGDADESSTPLRRFGISLVNKILLLFQGPSAVSDPTSGFRVYARRARKTLMENIPEQYPEPESIGILSVANQTIVEVPTKMRARTSGHSSIHGFGSASYMIKVMSSLIGLIIRERMIPMIMQPLTRQK